MAVEEKGPHGPFSVVLQVDQPPAQLPEVAEQESIFSGDADEGQRTDDGEDDEPELVEPVDRPQHDPAEGTQNVVHDPDVCLVLLRVHVFFLEVRHDEDPVDRVERLAHVVLQAWSGLTVEEKGGLCHPSQFSAGENRIDLAIAVTHLTVGPEQVDAVHECTVPISARGQAHVMSVPQRQDSRFVLVRSDEGTNLLDLGPVLRLLDLQYGPATNHHSDQHVVLLGHGLNWP